MGLNNTLKSNDSTLASRLILHLYNGSIDWEALKYIDIRVIDSYVDI